MTWRVICPVAALVAEAPVGVDLGSVAVCLVRLGDDVFAVHDECTHESVPLSDGEVDDGTIECWRRGSRFDLRTGAVLNPPAVRPVAVYQTRVVDGGVQVDVDG